MIKMFKMKPFGMAALLALAACTSKDNNLSVEFNKDSTAIVISNIEQTGLQVLKQDQRDGKNIDKIVSVLEIPGEDDSLSREKEFPGKIFINDEKVVFKPDQPFVKGKNYLVSTVINAHFGGTKDAVKLKLNARNQATEKTLIR